ncbi:MAG: MBL fold metallo-hydrolase [Bacteroidota bacterium]
MTKILSLTFNVVQENTYLVYDEASRDCIIFDPGCNSATEEQELVDTIEQHQLHPVKLINTHCHFDHVFGNAFVAKKYHLTLGAHPLEAPVLEWAPMALQMYGIPPMETSPLIDYHLNEGDIVTLGEARFEVLFCPGHSPGSICFHNKEEHYLIAGDVLFNGSIGRTDLPGGDHATLLGSIMTKLFPLPEETVVYPGHGGTTTIGKERASNPFF